LAVAAAVEILPVRLEALVLIPYLAASLLPEAVAAAQETRQIKMD
jgi:hypothetical protein